MRNGHLFNGLREQEGHKELLNRLYYGQTYA